MRDDEFNFVKITNERDGFSSFEFGATQNSEETSFSDNKNNIRDEVNDNPSTNSENNKRQEKKRKQEKENEDQLREQLSKSNSSEGGNSSGGSSGGAASGGGAVSGTSAIATVAGASLVAVTSVSALVGINLFIQARVKMNNLNVTSVSVNYDLDLTETNNDNFVITLENKVNNYYSYQDLIEGNNVGEFNELTPNTFYTLSVVDTSSDNYVIETREIQTSSEPGPLFSHKVSFYDDDGYYFGSMDINDGETIPYPDDYPTKSNRFFCYWGVEETEQEVVPFDFTTPVTEDLSLIASYEEFHNTDFNFDYFNVTDTGTLIGYDYGFDNLFTYYKDFKAVFEYVSLQYEKYTIDIELDPEPRGTYQMETEDFFSLEHIYNFYLKAKPIETKSTIEVTFIKGSVCPGNNRFEEYYDVSIGGADNIYYVADNAWYIPLTIKQLGFDTTSVDYYIIEYTTTNSGGTLEIPGGEDIYYLEFPSDYSSSTDIEFTSFVIRNDEEEVIYSLEDTLTLYEAEEQSISYALFTSKDIDRTNPVVDFKAITNIPSGGFESVKLRFDIQRLNVPEAYYTLDITDIVNEIDLFSGNATIDLREKGTTTASDFPDNSEIETCDELLKYLQYCVANVYIEYQAVDQTSPTTLYLYNNYSFNIY